jgi:hypothetical protein
MNNSSVGTLHFTGSGRDATQGFAGKRCHLPSVIAFSTFASSCEAVIPNGLQMRRSISTVGDFLSFSSILMYVRSTSALKANSSCVRPARIRAFRNSFPSMVGSVSPHRQACLLTIVYTPFSMEIGRIKRVRDPDLQGGQSTNARKFSI